MTIESVVLHLMTQRDQPYGSERICCERCGVMIYGPQAPKWTSNPSTYDKPPDGYVPCWGTT
jgi:hypothetical protein